MIKDETKTVYQILESEYKVTRETLRLINESKVKDRLKFDGCPRKTLRGSLYKWKYESNKETR